MKLHSQNSKLFRRIAQLALIALVTMLFLGAATEPGSNTLNGAAESQTDKPLLLGIDHIPVVVANLEQAQADFRAMGFAIKPGRPHADGIQNAHVKFPDGTEIELITASRAVDELTSEYREKLTKGEGPVYFAMYAPDPSALASRLKAIAAPAQDNNGEIVFPLDSPLHPLFFGQRNKTPSDRPEHFAHANTAVRLSALWVRQTPALRSLLLKLQIPLGTEPACGPMPGAGEMVAGLPEGKLYLVRSATANVLAARVEVDNLAILKAVLKKNAVPILQTECGASAVWVSPAHAHGIWLEFVDTKNIA